METQIIQLVKDLSYPAVIGLALLIIYKSNILGFLVDFLRSKTNQGVSPSIGERLDVIEDNHLHTIAETLNRIENKLDKMNDYLIFIKAKINGDR